MSNQNWNPNHYNVNAGFVSALGKPVIELLKPMHGERILDLGCGGGEMAKELAWQGFSIVGVDSSREMVEAARANGIDARLMDGEGLDFHE